MLRARPERLWLIAGVLAALLLSAVTYMLVISPARSDAASLRAQTDDASTQQAVQRRKLAQLRADAANIGQIKAQLTTAQAALPPTVDSATFLRTLQSVATTEGVSITTVNVGAGGSGSAATTTNPTVGALTPITVAINAAGSLDGLEGFLHELQSVQPRAVVVDKVDVTGGDAGGTGGAGVTGYTLSIGLSIFVVAAAG